MIEQPNAQDWAEVEKIFWARGSKPTEQQRACLRGWELSRIFARHREQVERNTIRRVVEWLRANSGFEDCYSELRDKWLSDRIEAGEWKQ